MTSVPQHIKEIFFQTKIGITSKDYFEAWLYQCKELEEHLISEDYLELVSFSYKSAHKVDFIKLIDKFIDPAEFAYYFLMFRLNEALDKSKHPGILDNLYYLYCDGYSFMDTLGLIYGLHYAETCINFGQNSPKAKDFIDKYFPDFELEIAKVKTLLETGQIIITGESQESCYNYLDLRR